jgi:hypothetical protein
VVDRNILVVLTGTRIPPIVLILAKCCLIIIDITPTHQISHLIEYLICLSSVIAKKNHPVYSNVGKKLVTGTSSTFFFAIAKIILNIPYRPKTVTLSLLANPKPRNSIVLIKLWHDNGVLKKEKEGVTASLDSGGEDVGGAIVLMGREFQLPMDGV